MVDTAQRRRSPFVPFAGLKSGRGVQSRGGPTPSERRDEPAPSEEPGTTIATRLADRCGRRVLFLHHRRRAAGQLYGEIDHLAVTASGIYVIDAKGYDGADVTVRRRWRRRDALVIRGDDRSALVDVLDQQAAAVRVALAGTPWATTPVVTVFCFLDVELPLPRDLAVDGHLVRGTRDTAQLLISGGPLTTAERQAIWEHLRTALPAL